MAGAFGFGARALSKALFFGIAGALGCVAAALTLGEPLLALTLPAPPPPPETKTTGPVAHAEKGKITLTLDGKEKTFVVPDAAAVLIDDKAGKVENVHKDSGAAVTEKGDAVTRVEVKSPPEPQVDVVFVLDVTESMQDEIDGVRDGVSRFAEELGKRAIDARVAVLAFRDDLEEPPELEQRLLFDGRPFTSDYHVFRQEVIKLKASGGGDIPESSLDALASAATLPFRPKATKVLLLITDAPPHVPDKRVRSLNEAAQALKDHGIDQLHVVAHKDDYLDYFEAVQKGAPGKFFPIEEEKQKFEAVLPEVGERIAAATVETQPVSSGTKVLVAGGEVASQSWLQLLAALALWTSTLSAGAALALVVGQNLHLRRPWLSAAEGVKGALGGLAAGAAAGVAGQLLFQQGASWGPAWETASRIIGWALLGALVGAVMALFVRNLSAVRTFFAGGVGGAVGAAAYVGLSGAVGGVTGRLAGAAILGFCIGLMVALAEALFREAWLDVHYGPRESRAVSLGAQPVTIGGDPGCTIFIRGAAPVALRYTFEKGQIICGGQPVVPGDQRRVGAVRVVANAIGGPRTAAAPAAVPVPVAAYPASFTLRLASGKTLSLTKSARLRAVDFPGVTPAAGDGVVAEVVPNPTNPAILGLKNLSRLSWSATLPGGGARQVDPGRSIQLQQGAVIQFGLLRGEVR